MDSHLKLLHNLATRRAIVLDPRKISCGQTLQHGVFPFWQIEPKNRNERKIITLDRRTHVAGEKITTRIATIQKPTANPTRRTLSASNNRPGDMGVKYDRSERASESEMG